MYRLSFLMIIIGAALWGTIGVFVQGLYDLGFTPIEVVTLRVIFAFFAIFLFSLWKDRGALKIKLKHIFYFVGTGIFSIVFFNWAYFTAIQEMNLSIAAVLLYTGPAFVTIMSRIFFKELFTPQKLVALVMTFIGCIFVIGLFPLNVSLSQISLYGVIVGIGSGFGYALYTIFGKLALKHYTSMTITIYTFLLASVALLPTTGLVRRVGEWLNWESLLISLGLGIVPTVVAYLLYTKGLEKVESSKASIMTTIEPVVAALIGVFVFKDVLSFWQVCGMVFIISAVLLINMGAEQKETVKSPSEEKFTS